MKKFNIGASLLAASIVLALAPLPVLADDAGTKPTTPATPQQQQQDKQKQRQQRRQKQEQQQQSGQPTVQDVPEPVNLNSD